MFSETKLYRKAAILTLVFSVVIVFVVYGVFGVWALLSLQDYLSVACAYGCMGVFVWMAAPRWGAACTKSLPLAGLFGIMVLLLGSAVVSLTIYSLSAADSFGLGPALALFAAQALVGVVPAFLIGFAGALFARQLHGPAPSPNHALQRTAG